MQSRGLKASTLFHGRQYQHREVTEVGTFGWGDGWKLETFDLSESQKVELDALYGDMDRFVEKGGERR